jgi:hypothetical protein
MQRENTGALTIDRFEQPASEAPADDSFDGNCDDSCAPNYAYNTTNCLLNSLFTTPASSWQCGGQGFDSP